MTRVWKHSHWIRVIRANPRLPSCPEIVARCDDFRRLSYRLAPMNSIRVSSVAFACRSTRDRIMRWNTWVGFAAALLIAALSLATVGCGGSSETGESGGAADHKLLPV